MKETDQRSKNSLLIKCNCGYNHFLEFDYWVDDEKRKDEDKIEKTKKLIWKDYTISLIDDTNPGFWFKVKKCWEYLFTNRGEACCHAGILINSKDMKRIIKHFEKYMNL